MKKIKKTIGLIGCGNMGSAILAGLIKNRIARARQIYIYDGIRAKMNSLSRSFGVKRAKDNRDLIRKTQIVILAVKPQDLRRMAEEIRNLLTSNHVIISILAGTPIQKLKRVLGTKLAVVRAMPNLGAQVGEAITAITSANHSALRPFRRPRKRTKRPNAGRALAALRLAQIIFLGCGEVIELPEKHFDLVTAVSGSGPAYFFLMMELLAKAAERKGISKQAARLLAVQTALGAARLACEASDSPELLRKKVTSKKGTTDAALKYLWKKKFPSAFLGAIDQAVKRARQLSKL